ncbi:hypothetical protein LXL04_029315 [Taraxacum kok-saghyz]
MSTHLACKSREGANGSSCYDDHYRNVSDSSDMFNGRSKHIDISYHFIRECVGERQIVVEHADSKGEHADILTKASTHVKYGEIQVCLA